MTERARGPWRARAAAGVRRHVRAALPAELAHVGLGVTRDFCTISKAHLDEILDQRMARSRALLTHRSRRRSSLSRTPLRAAGRRGAEAEAEAEAEAAARGPRRRPAAEGRAERAGGGFRAAASGTRRRWWARCRAAFDAYMSIAVSLEDKQLARGARLPARRRRGWTRARSARAVDDRVFKLVAGAAHLALAQRARSSAAPRCRWARSC